MQTLRAERFRKELLRQLWWGFLVLAILTTAAGFLLPGRPLVSALVGVVGAGLIMGTTALALSRMVRAPETQIGWLVGDYLGKIVVTAGAILFVKYVLAEPPLFVAVVLIGAILISVYVQVSAAARAGKDPRR